MLIISTLLGCSKEEEVEDNGLLFDVVYQATEVRENRKFSWSPVSGKMQVKFIQNTETEGNFIVHMSGYSEQPRFVFNNCSGGFKGNFQTVEIDSSANACPTTGNYDPSLPCTSGTTIAESGDYTLAGGEDEPAQISQYHMKFLAAGMTSSLDPACRPSEDSEQTVHIYRFSNGEIIMRKEYRDIKMRPVLTSESEIPQ